MPGCSLSRSYGPGDAEIGHHRVAGVEQDVRRLDVPVHHVGAMGVAQRIRHLARDLERVVDGELAFPGQTLPEGLSLDVRHDIVGHALSLIGIVERQDVGMVETRGDLNLAEKPDRSYLRGDVGAEDLDGNRALVLEVMGEVDPCHPTLAQLPLESVAGSESRLETVERVGHYRPLIIHRGCPPERVLKRFPRVSFLNIPANRGVARWISSGGRGLCGGEALRCAQGKLEFDASHKRSNHAR